METLYKPNLYPKEIREQISQMPPLSIEIANRWALGWPETVKELIQAGEYLEALMRQEAEERNILSRADARNLARHEIIQEFGLSLSPPSPPLPTT